MSSLSETPRVPGTIAMGNRELGPVELSQRVEQIAGGLARLGVGAQSRVAVLMRNDPVLLEVSLAASLLGAAAVPINWHGTQREVRYVLDDCAAQIVFVHADLLDLIGDWPAHRAVVVDTPLEIRQAFDMGPPPGAAIGTGHLRWNEWLADSPRYEGPGHAARPSVIYTSGTTGAPKGVLRDIPTPQQVAAGQVLSRSVHGMQEGMRTALIGPAYHSAPNMYALSALRLGGYLLVMPRFDPEALLAAIEQHQLTHLTMAPTMFVRLLRLPAQTRQRYDLSSLRFVSHAAAPCPPDVKHAMIEWWGPIILEYYGSTETSAVVACNSQEWLAHPGTVGRVVANASVEIVDDSGQAVPPGTTGEIYACRLDGPGFSYINRPEETATSHRGPRVSTGDVGYFDDEGYLYICDRKRDMVISGGVNIYPAEIESVLQAMAGVHDCAVFGVPNEEFGESLMAVIEAQQGVSLSADAVQAYLRQHLAGFKVPRHIEFRQDLPREDSGKIFKRRLREPYWQGRQNRV